jgi:hypothetical protein
VVRGAREGGTDEEGHRALAGGADRLDRSLPSPNDLFGSAA